MYEIEYSYWKLMVRNQILQERFTGDNRHETIWSNVFVLYAFYDFRALDSLNIVGLLFSTITPMA